MKNPDPQAAIDSLAPECRLALTYALGDSRPLFFALFALDARLSSIVCSAREPMLAQLKLAWWREQLGNSGDERAKGEPVLAALTAWGDKAGELVKLVDGWEHLLASDRPQADDFAAFFQARGSVCRSLAEMLGADPAAARDAGIVWGCADLVHFFPNEKEQQLVSTIAKPVMDRIAPLDRSMRPLVILRGLACRKLAHPDRTNGPCDLLLAMRLGILGI